MYVESKTPEQLEALALTVYINELGDRLNRLHAGDLEDNEDMLPRSASPPPEYDREGRRINTRYMRRVKELEIERTLAVHRALELIPHYSPPVSFTKLTRSVQKYYLPVRSYPQINFIGLLLGPRGKNLRRMETEAGAKISIRGRGSVKEGSRLSNEPAEEDLHCVVSSTSQQCIQKAFTLIKEVVDNAIRTPEHMNDFKRLQLRELAQLNGTLRDYENQVCGYCRQPGHKYAECPQRQSLKAESTCKLCGEFGHYMAECKNNNSLAVEDFMRDIEGDESEMRGPHGPQVQADTTQRSMESPGSQTKDGVAENGGSTEKSELPELIRPKAIVSQANGTPRIEPPGILLGTLPPNASLPGMPGPPPGFILPEAVSPASGIAPPGIAQRGTFQPVASSRLTSPRVASPGDTPPGITPPGTAPSGISPQGVPPPGIAPPGIASPEIAPPGIASPGIAPPGIVPPGIETPGIAPPGIVPPGIAPPGIVSSGNALQGNAPPGVSSLDILGPPGMAPGISQPIVVPPSNAPPEWKPPSKNVS